MPSIMENLSVIREKIAFCAEKYGRNPEAVKLLAVSKTFPYEDIFEAYKSGGQICFGENRIQELETKVPVLPSEIEWHLIGHLQSNKASKAVELAQWVHSIDSIKLLTRLDRIAGELGKRLNILLEINISGEQSKEGVRDLKELMNLASTAVNAKNLSWRGLMTMAEYGAEETRLRKTFSGLRELRDQLENEFKIKLPELSMGMSGDFEEAIAEGSTILRIGTAIFGNRG